MNQFELYTTLGLQHILDIEGYDHMLFMLVLLAPIPFKEWKKVLWLITSFTVGHSLSLALSTLNIVSVDPSLVELCIAISIFLTGVLNWFKSEHLTKYRIPIIALFGIIHGLGFSGYLKSILGNEENLTVPLLSFNIGLEVGQIIFAVIFYIVVSILNTYLSVKQRTINLAFSIIAMLVALMLILDRV